MNYFLTIGFVALLVQPVAFGQSATGWRGNGTGIFDSQQPPIQWSNEKNVIWKTKLPTASKGSPIILNDLVFLQSYPHTLVCIRRTDGELLWQKSHPFTDARPGEEGQGLVRKHPVKPIKDLYWPAGNDLSQTTPISDGKSVYCAFGNGVVSSHKLNGERLWIKFIEFPNVKYGLASSPVLAGGKLIVHLNDLIALDPKTGREVWRTKVEPSHSTAFVSQIGRTEVLVHPAGSIIRVKDGKVLAKDLFDADRASPVVHDDVIYVHGKTFFFAVQLPKSIDASPRRLWETKANYAGYSIASPVLLNGTLYGVNRNGILEAVNAKSGEQIYRERLPLGNKVFSGITVAGGLMFIGNEKGTHVVVRPGAEYEEVSRNDLGEMIDASPVFYNNQLFLRGKTNLYCVGKKSE